MPKNKKTSSTPSDVANIYFAIEALKRSEKMKRYPKGGLDRRIICANCGINEGWLEGNDHERYLSVSSRNYRKANRNTRHQVLKLNLDLYDLKILARTPRHEPMPETPRDSLEAYIRYPKPDPEGIVEIDGEGMVLALLRDHSPNLLCLALPMQEKPNELIKLLKPFLEKRHAEAMKVPKSQGTIAREKRNKSYFEDIKAWRRNIRCWNLQYSQPSPAHDVGPIGDV